MIKKILAGLAGILVGLAITTAALAHPAPKPHGNAYQHNTFPNGYFDLYEPDGARYRGINSLEDQLRYYLGYKKAMVNGRKYYRITAVFRWVDPQGQDHIQTKPLYAALHKYGDPGSDRPAFRVYMTRNATGKHYWRRFEARGSVPPNTVIVGTPDFPVHEGERVTFKLFSPDATAKFMCRVEPLGVKRGPYRKCGKTVTYTVSGEPQIFQVRAYDAAGHVDETPAKVKYDPF